MSAAPALEEGAIHVWRGSLDQVPEVQPAARCVAFEG